MLAFLSCLILYQLSRSLMWQPEVGHPVQSEDALPPEGPAPAMQGFPRPVVSVEAFTLPVSAIPALGSNSTDPVVLVADAFLADGCAKLVSVITCAHCELQPWGCVKPRQNFSLLDFEVVGVWGGSSSCGDGGCASARRAPSRVLHRDGSNWEPVTIIELCLPELNNATRVDIMVWQDGYSHAYSLAAIEPEPAAEFAMTVMYRGDGWTAPAFLDVWTALGVGHFYVYFNGDLDAFRAESPRLAAEFERDPRITLLIWPYPMRSVVVDTKGESVLPPVNKYGKIMCYLHYAKMMAFNSTFHRYGSRHAYMGFFDWDEYLGLPQSLYDDALALGITPLAALRAAHGDPEVFVVQNRWSVLLPPPEQMEPLRSSHVLASRIFGGWFTDWKARTKFFVRSSDIGRPEIQPYMVGNHYICKLADRARIRSNATEQFSGRCNQIDPTMSEMQQLPPPEYYSMHLSNLKPHESLLDYDEDIMMQQMLENDTETRQVHGILAPFLERAGGA